MSKFLVTGVAGFIGSRIASQLLDDNHVVIGIDSFNEILYKNDFKESQILGLKKRSNFTFIKENILNVNLDSILSGVDYVINEAGLPGQLVSWEKIEDYFESNTIATSKLYEACVRNEIKSFVQASTSSVYGLSAIGKENQILNPKSPYGVTKLAAEHLINALNTIKSPRTVILRYFSVYGPGQRPDMGIYKFIQSIKTGKVINIYGDGNQTRDFTFVSDVARATILASLYGKDGEVYNISGGEPTSINNLLRILEDVTQTEIYFEFVDRPRGDQLSTLADTTKARIELEWAPRINLVQGLRDQYLWQKQLN